MRELPVIGAGKLVDIFICGYPHQTIGVENGTSRNSVSMPVNVMMRFPRRAGETFSTKVADEWSCSGARNTPSRFRAQSRGESHSLRIIVKRKCIVVEESAPTIFAGAWPGGDRRFI